MIKSNQLPTELLPTVQLQTDASLSLC